MRATYQGVLVNLQDCLQSLYTAQEHLIELSETVNLQHDLESAQHQLDELLNEVSKIVEARNASNINRRINKELKIVRKELQAGW